MAGKLKTMFYSLNPTQYPNLILSCLGEVSLHSVMTFNMCPPKSWKVYLFYKVSINLYANVIQNHLGRIIGNYILLDKYLSIIVQLTCHKTKWHKSKSYNMVGKLNIWLACDCPRIDRWCLIWASELSQEWSLRYWARKLEPEVISVQYQVWPQAPNVNKLN